MAKQFSPIPDLIPSLHTRRSVIALWTKGKTKEEMIKNKVFYYLPDQLAEK
jgi:hypothetical protein